MKVESGEMGTPGKCVGATLAVARKKASLA